MVHGEAVVKLTEVPNIFCDWCDHESKPHVAHFPAPAPYAQASICKDCLDFIVRQDNIGAGRCCAVHRCGAHDDIVLSGYEVRGRVEWKEYRCAEHRVWARNIHGSEVWRCK